MDFKAFFLLATLALVSLPTSATVQQQQEKQEQEQDECFWLCMYMCIETTGFYFCYWH